MKRSTLLILAAVGVGAYVLTRKGTGTTMDPDLWAVSLFGQSGLSPQSQWYYRQFLGMGYAPEEADEAARAAAVADSVNDRLGWGSGSLGSL